MPVKEEPKSDIPVAGVHSDVEPLDVPSSSTSSSAAASAGRGNTENGDMAAPVKPTSSSASILKSKPTSTSSSSSSSSSSPSTKNQKEATTNKRSPKNTNNNTTTTTTTTAAIVLAKEKALHRYYSDRKTATSSEEKTNSNNSSSIITKKNVKPYPKVEPPTTAERLNRAIRFGEVRATLYGSCLDSPPPLTSSSSSPSPPPPNTTKEEEEEERTKTWMEWRQQNFDPRHFPTEGFDHIYSAETISQSEDAGAEAAAMALHKLGYYHTQSPHNTELSNNDVTETKKKKKQENENDDDGREYGATRTPLDAPISSLRDKWRVLPHFLQLRGLMRQHIDSYDYFVNIEMKEIVQSPSACEIRSDYDPKFYLRYTDCWVGTPSIDEEDMYSEVGVGGGVGGGGGVGNESRDPKATPFKCRLRDCTYSAPIYVNIRYTRGRKIIVKKKVMVGRMPIMLRSTKCLLHNKSERELAAMKECPYDPGGYFIIKGVEKAILIQEQLSKNRVIIEEDSSGNICAQITSSTRERKSKGYILIKNGKIYMKHNTLGDPIPIVLILKAMGVESDLELVQLVGSEPEIMDSLAHSLEEPVRLGISTQKQALRYIGKKIRSRKTSYDAGPGSSYRKPQSPEEEARDVLANVVLSHVPVPHWNFRSKCIYVGHIVRRVVMTQLGRASVDDKDYYGNKRLELAGNLLSLLFEDLFKIFSRNLKMQADRILAKANRAQEFDAVKHIRPDTISQGMFTAISTGNWVLKRFRMDRAGVTQVLSRLSYVSALGMMTRVNSQFEKTRKVSGPRSLQPSQWGMLCPADTPEGEACGLVKNLALLAHITTDEDTFPIERLCRDLGVEDVNMLSGNEINALGSYLVLLNGNILGVHTRPAYLVKQLRTMRRQGQAGEFVSFYMHSGQRAVHIATDGGRVCRPMIIVNEATAMPRLTQAHVEGLVVGTITIQDLLRQCVVEYIDVNEENNCLIAVTERDLEIARREGLHSRKMAYTHLEIDPLTLLGVVCGLVPNPHHNQSPRNTYQCAMGKQAIGAISLNEYARMDGLIYTMIYPMKPMVKSRTLDLIHFDELPGGQNACIAVMSYSGYDIEDAVILNKASVDRGFGRCMVLRKHQTSIKQYANGALDRTCGPPDPSQFPAGEQDKRYARYRAIDKDGICLVGEELENGTLMVNKESPVDTSARVGVGGAGGTDDAAMAALSMMEYKSCGMSYRSSAPSYVDKVIITSNENDHFLIKVMVRQVRRPEVGDKFASRHGQKGVVGLIVPQVDMPFNEFGHPPDLIMNPHGFPSRMTVGKLIELLVGKAGVYQGRQAYASAFGEEFGSTDTPSSASEILIRNGLNYTGKDLFYSGTSGEPLDAYIFSGPVFYQKLKHMVLDKMHARARGPRAVLTRQPTEGRSRDGGLRLGEMERDCLVAYGASNLLIERLMDSSDGFTANVCQTCGLLQYQNWCQYCRSGEKMADMRLPYACKLLFQELQSMNVLPRLRLQDV